MRVALYAFSGLLLVAVLSFFILSSASPLGAQRFDRGARYTWEFADAGVDATGNPRTLLTLDVPGNSYSIGMQHGTCAMNDGVFWNFLSGETLSAICWQGESGVEVGVFEEGDRTLVKTSQLSYSDALDPLHRGNFKPIFAL